jgi:hypothetical protein
MGTVRALKPELEPAPEPARLTRRPKGMGPLYTLCPKCRGDTPRPSLTSALQPRCARCDGKGMVLE